MRQLLKNICRLIEGLFPGIKVYAYQDTLGDGSKFWCVNVSDYDVYFSTKFKTFSATWRNVGDKRGEKIVFCCCPPINGKITKLYGENNIIVNL